MACMTLSLNRQDLRLLRATLLAGNLPANSGILPRKHRSIAFQAGCPLAAPILGAILPGFPSHSATKLVRGIDR